MFLPFSFGNVRERPLSEMLAEEGTAALPLDRDRTIAALEHADLHPAGPSPAGGVQIVFGVEGSSPAQVDEYLSQTRLGCWRRSELPSGPTKQPERLPSQPGLA